MTNSRTFFYLLLFLLIGCGGKAEKTSSPARSVESSKPILGHTETFDEATVLKVISEQVLSGAAVSSVDAEKCWKSEKARNLVRQACILGWSAGEEASPFLENELFIGATKDRSLALAAIRRKITVSAHTLEELSLLLEIVSNDPPWLRALAIEEWLKEHARPQLADTQALWRSFLGMKKIDSLDPASAMHAYRLARTLDIGLEEQLLTQFCAPAAISLAQVRCWRFLSTLVDPSTGQGLDKSARLFLPLRREEGWVLFERSFTERAALLRPYR